MISFIVPIFNARAYLSACVESLMNQGLEDGSYEIILVNDGSTDGSENLCEELAGKHLFIHVINQANLGLSAARNTGIREAKGEFLCFVDSDDSLVAGSLADLVPLCDGQDIVRFWCKLVYPKASKEVNPGSGDITFSGTGTEFVRRYGLETFCLNYLYRRSFLEGNHLRFKQGIIGEDFPFMYDVMMANPNVISVAKQIYLYNIHPDSISTRRNTDNSRCWVNDMSGTLIRIASDLEKYRTSDPVLFKSCHLSLDRKMLSLFSRALTANYSIQEFRAILSVLRNNDLLPLRFNHNLIVFLLNKYPFLYPIASTVYRRIFIPYIYPHIDRNH